MRWWRGRRGVATLEDYWNCCKWPKGGWRVASAFLSKTTERGEVAITGPAFSSASRIDRKSSLPDTTRLKTPLFSPLFIFPLPFMPRKRGQKEFWPRFFTFNETKQGHPFFPFGFRCFNYSLRCLYHFRAQALLYHKHFHLESITVNPKRRIF